MLEWMMRKVLLIFNYCSPAIRNQSLTLQFIPAGILIALSQPHVHVVGISCVHGNVVSVSHDRCCTNLLQLQTRSVLPQHRSLLAAALYQRFQHVLPLWHHHHHHPSPPRAYIDVTAGGPHASQGRECYEQLAYGCAHVLSLLQHCSDSM